MSNETENLPTLTHHLAQELQTGTYEQNTLRRQADLLDQMLNNLMHHHLQCDPDKGYAWKISWIETALKIQKQCADTLKAAAATEYMKSIAPAPLKNSKQNE